MQRGYLACRHNVALTSLMHSTMVCCFSRSSFLMLATTVSLREECTAQPSTSSMRRRSSVTPAGVLGCWDNCSRSGRLSSTCWPVTSCGEQQTRLRGVLLYTHYTYTETIHIYKYNRLIQKQYTYINTIDLYRNNILIVSIGIGRKFTDTFIQIIKKIV